MTTIRFEKTTAAGPFTRIPALPIIPATTTQPGGIGRLSAISASLRAMLLTPKNIKSANEPIHLKQNKRPDPINEPIRDPNEPIYRAIEPTLEPNEPNHLASSSMTPIQPLLPRKKIKTAVRTHQPHENTRPATNFEPNLTPFQTHSSSIRTHFYPVSPSNRPSPRRHLAATPTLTLSAHGDSVRPLIFLVKEKSLISLPAICLVLILSLAGQSLADDAVLPDGKGRDAVENACTVCHSADRIMRQAMTLDQWRSELRTMVENGASLNPDEWEPVVAYLVKNFGPKVNVNTASAAQISAGLQFTAAEADAIVAYRLANGTFKDIKELARVPGLDAKKIGSQETRIVF